MKQYKFILVPSYQGYSHIGPLEERVNAMAREGWTLHSVVAEGRSWPHIAVMECEVTAKPK